MSMFNPETMKNLMENDDIQKMMNDPKIMNNLQNMMGNMDGNDLFKGLNPDLQSDESCTPNTDCCPDDSKCCPDDSKCCPDDSKCCPDDSKCCPDECDDINIDNLENIEINESRLNIGDKVSTKDLKNDAYNNKNAVIEDLLPNGRFVITIGDKTIAVKEENLANIYENIEHID